MRPDEAAKILGPYAKFVDLEASTIAMGDDPDTDHENWLKHQGWNMASTGPELFESLGMFDMTRAEQREKIQELVDSGRMAHAPAAVVSYLEARGLLDS